MSSKLDKFFKGSDLTPTEAQQIIKDGLDGTDFGEFYQEITDSESIVKDKGVYAHVSSGNGASGYGFRVGQGEKTGYVFSDEFNKQALQDVISEARKILKSGQNSKQQMNFGSNKGPYYPSGNPMDGIDFDKKIDKIDEIEAYTLSLDPNIENVSISYSSKAQDVHIITADGKSLVDERPMTSLSISIALKGTDGKIEVGSAMVGGRATCKDVFNEAAYKNAAKEALDLAKILLVAEDAPAGEMDVVLNHGWPAVLLHEAVGHGLEGDFNRRGISVYSGKVGQQIASKEVTVYDSGNMPGERGSLHFDDEGTPTQENKLIDKGVLTGYMQDRQNAQLMGVPPTGNGRRQSYAHEPMPRMTNTYFGAGDHEPEDIIKSVKDGLYCDKMGGGQVDITSGKFNMNVTLAYRIRDGKIRYDEPVKGAALVGKGHELIQNITMVGNDLELEKTAGVCGKDGQSVVVSCGQPTIKARMIVGGSGPS